ncbi:MAG TPA: metallophosphoesterase [Acidimicrobiales bacterium]|jgi:Icc protein|nr:metallophosphoesterase [Acidimicrobiales bacterium]
MAQPVRVVQLSDTHFGGPSAGESREGPGARDPAETLDAVFDDILSKRLTPDVVVVTGDLANHGTADAYRALGERLARVGLPVHCLAGNHDFVEPLEANLSRAGVSLDRTARFDDWLFLFLDTNAAARVADASGQLHDAPNRVLRANRGLLSATELTWVAEVLSGSDARNVMVWMHHPPLSPPGHHGLDRAAFTDPLFDALERDPRVRGIGAGHIHAFYECQRSGIRVFSCPSTWLTFDVDAEVIGPPGYLSYVLFPSGDIEVTVHVVDDRRYAEPAPLPPFVGRMLRGEIDLDRLEEMSLEDLLAQSRRGGLG